ncbi:nucleotidyl transferase AbiEii/AbiGii toxin family protein [Herbaspirillum sp. GCM10030257]|uniref:nucleotidyl transferase AbiEii/AbiGii toxin family protein n=1 Tax=Herbaspirillum sp. GCM10030257 TaxID=3273393 RepID=UPI00360E690B
MQKHGAQSVLARLKNKAKEEGIEYQQVLTRYGLERMLYRLSQSRHVDSFLLKGAMLFNLWFDMPHRPTRDVDLLGFSSHGLEALVIIFREVCEIDADDGIVFDAKTVKSAEIRKESNYEGVRVTFLGLIDNVRCPIQIDIGYGDAVIPEAEQVEYPVLLNDMPKPALRAYPRYTVVAEKTEAVIKLAMANTRLKNFFDLWILSTYADFDGTTMQRALATTLTRRKTAVDSDPVGLSDAFAGDLAKQTQWNAFVRKNKLNAPDLPFVVATLRQFLLPVLNACSKGEEFNQRWLAKGPWCH